MKKRLLASVVVATLGAPAVTFAQAATPAADNPPHTISGNFSLVSDYRFRGISQTDRDPAIQGGFDYVHSSGFYIGNWNSSVTTDLYHGGAGLEMDLYAGFKPSYGDFTFDVGVLQYYYPGAKIEGTNQRYDTTEIYAGVAYGPLSFKTWYGVSHDWFGSDDAKGSLYYELNGALPLREKLSLVAHAGYQDVNDTPDADYFDYRLGLTYDLRGWLLGAAVAGTNADDDVYGDLGDTTVIFSVGKTF